MRPDAIPTRITIKQANLNNRGGILDTHVHHFGSDVSDIAPLSLRSGRLVVRKALFLPVGP